MKYKCEEDVVVTFIAGKLTTDFHYCGVTTLKNDCVKNERNIFQRLFVRLLNYILGK